MAGSVLISGAGIAGATLAYWLGRQGFDVTVVERAEAQPSSGNPVDVRGPAVEVAERMGVGPALRAVATDTHRLVFVDAVGRQVAAVRMSAFRGSAGDREFEIGRADLASILLRAAHDYADIWWGDTVTGLSRDLSGVDVTFAHGVSRRFDLVVGADGLHSTVRRLAFGPEARFLQYLGMYVATVPVAESFGYGRDVVLYNTPGRVVGTHPAGGHPGVVFMFRRATVPGFSSGDLAGHKQLIADEFTGRAGIFDTALDQVRASRDVYFDEVSRVRLPAWSRDRVVLVGDAASCVSLFGDGSSTAIAGSHTLATALAAGGDVAAALQAYEHQHRRLVARKQRGFRMASGFLVPRTRAGLAVRHAAIRNTSSAAGGRTCCTTRAPCD